MKRLYRTLALAFLLCLLFPKLFRGAGGIGNDNPTGVTGEYNGSITTGGSYDPWTGNAKRFIDDLTVTGSVGEYPLKFTRILNTRGGSGAFGDGGGWKHSYQWGLSVNIHPSCAVDYPHATVSYPDGRQLNFYYHSETDTYEDTSGGWPGDRLVHVGNQTSTDYDLKLKDGGTVQFRTVFGQPHFPKYIVDLYGQTTTLDYIDHSPNPPTLWKITEPAGRYLQITYKVLTAGSPMEVIDFVEAYDGLGNKIEKVLYGYVAVPWSGGMVNVTFYNLISANYDDGHHGTYDYDPPQQITNDPWSWTAGNVKTCDDTRFAGAMSKIKYDYVLPHENLGCPVGRGQIKAERNMTTGQLVSSIVYPSGTECMYTNSARWIRTETRGDTATRKFTYSGDPRGGTPELVSYTDFAFPGETYHTTTISYSTYAPDIHYFKTVTDPRPSASPTKVEMEPKISAVVALIHGNGSSIQFQYTDPDNPYYVSSKTDENHNTTFYDRYCVGANPCFSDNKNRVWRIRYPDGGFETFHYNNFGQVLTHLMTSGGTEQFTYTVRGLKESFTPPATLSDPNPGDHPTRYFYYDAGNTAGRFDRIDRLYYVRDPLLHATTFDYNQWGQVITLKHHDNTFTQNQYYDDGTLHIVTDEMAHSTIYTYDEYKRVLSVENAEHEMSRNSYDPGYNLDEHLSLTHTTSSVYQATSFMGKIVRHKYDANFRLSEMTEAFGTDDVAVTSFTYDEVGNQTTITRPNGQPGTPHPAHSTITYDDRNRRKSLTDELDHKTEWIYDDVGNMKKETRADTKFRTWDVYDAMNRIKHTTGFLNEQTSYDYDLAGNLWKVTDTNQSTYETLYDKLKRKETAKYPLAGSASEVWRYDAAGRLKLYKNTANQYKHFVYDERNRQTGSYWNSSEMGTDIQQAIGDHITTAFDGASRVTSIATDGLSAYTSISFTYDNANRKKWEDQTLNGSLTRRVETLPDGDGNRGTLSVSGVDGGYAFTYDYTSRQQLFHINKTGAGQYFEYTYDKNGNLKKRQDVLQGGDSTIFDYDKGNRVMLCVQTGANDAAFSRSNYNDYDLVNNLQSITREEDQWKGERFTYDDANQLSGASYRVDVAPHAPEQPDPVPGQLGTVGEVSEDSEKDALAVLVADPDREPLAQRGGSGGGLDADTGPRVVTYLNDSINRLSMTDNGTVTNYTPNSLNQYTAVADHTPLYDAKFNLLSGYDDWVYTYDADKRLISADSAADGGHHAQFVYDGLGRCVRRTIDGTATVFTFDEWKPIVEWTGAGVFVAWNLYGRGEDEILVRYQPNTGGSVHYKLDPMGNVQFLLSGQLNLGLEKYTYDAFGKPRIVGWNGDVRPISRYGNRFLFTGREYLYTLGIYDYRHRHYHPGLGRFIQTDPVGFAGDPMNLYRYCSGNPVLHGDPTGLVATGRDSVWEMAKWFDSANKEQGTFQEHLTRLDRQAAGVTMAQISKKEEGKKNANPNAPAYMTRRIAASNEWVDSNGTHWVWKQWVFTLFNDKNQRVGRGVQFQEGPAGPTLDQKVNYKEIMRKVSDHATNEKGEVVDNWTFGFTTTEGSSVRATQTVSTGESSAYAIHSLRIWGTGAIEFLDPKSDWPDDRVYFCNPH